MQIDRVLPFLVHEQRLDIRFKKRSGQEDTLACRCAYSTAHIDYRHQCVAVVIRSNKVIRFHYDTGRHVLLQLSFEILPCLFLVVAQNILPPTQCLAAGEVHPDDSLQLAFAIQLQIRDAQHLRVFVAKRPGFGNGCAPIHLAHASCKGVLPMQLSKLAIALTRIEKHLLAIHLNNGNIVIQLVPVHVVLDKKSAVAIDHPHGIGFHTCRARHGD
jgi:hypothetical protein